MTPKACIVDTNVIVSGLIGADPNGPPARILDAMLDGNLLYLMSADLLTSHPQGQLITGDRLLLKNPPSDASVISPRRFVDAFLSLKRG